jgi:hypothetical protein
MKKRITFFAFAAALAFCYSCSNDETVATNDNAASNEISFRALTNGVTRAADVTEETLHSSGFTVTAVNHGSTPETQYFYGVSFVWNNPAYTSATKYYWPETGSLDFYAYAPAGNSQVSYPTSPNYKEFTVTPSSTVSEQVDLVYANTNEKTKATSASGVVLNFRHTESKIAIKVKNTSADLKFDVTGWKVGYLSGSGTFTYSGSNTDTKNSAQLTSGMWGSLATASADTKYQNTFSSQTIPASTGSETTITGSTEMILVPQSQTAASAYANSGVAAIGDKVNGSYIALQMTVKSNANNATIVSNCWAIWPVSFTWQPGKKYTYIVDLAGGGYHETNTDANADLDPVLEGTEIKFVSVTVDDWSNADDVTVPAAP